jgi:hypothetical protein
MVKSAQLETGESNTGKYWYKFYYTECVLCGRGDEWKERQHTPKPEDPQQRYDYRQNACSDHFL